MNKSPRKIIRRLNKTTISSTNVTNNTLSDDRAPINNTTDKSINVTDKSDSSYLKPKTLPKKTKESGIKKPKAIKKSTGGGESDQNEDKSDHIGEGSNQASYDRHNQASDNTELDKKNENKKLDQELDQESKCTDTISIYRMPSKNTRSNPVSKTISAMQSNSSNVLLDPMRKYRLVADDKKQLPIFNKKYKIKKLEEIKQRVSQTKSKLDADFTKHVFGKYWKEFDPFKNEKIIVAKLGNTCNVSNAWIKCYEIINHFGLIPQNIDSDTFLHFDNAAFPGSFVLSAHHYINTNFDWKHKYRWVASSLLDRNDENRAPLEDKYKLYENYQSNWLMTNKNNGDVLVENNQKDFNKRIGGKVDLYTSDLGFDVSSDYNNQELIQAPANIGQILSGLLTLKKGGCFITKQYSTFEPITVSIMYAAASFFDEFYICKPYSSREANSETYLVGKGFKDSVTIDHPYIRAMFDRTSKKIDISVPLFDAKDYLKSYLPSVIKMSEEIFNAQINKINLDVERVYDCIKSNYRGSPSDNPIVREFVDQEKSKLEMWYYHHPIRVLDDADQLKMKDIFHQKYN